MDISNQIPLYPTGRKFSFEYKFCHLAKYQNLNSAYYHIFRKLSIIAYIIEIQKFIIR